MARFYAMGQHSLHRLARVLAVTVKDPDTTKAGGAV